MRYCKLANIVPIASSNGSWFSSLVTVRRLNNKAGGYGRMVPKEDSYLLGKYEVVRINTPETPKAYDFGAEDMKYYAVQPDNMRFRLCLFWTFWAALIVIFAVSILAYCWCIIPTTCAQPV